MNYENIIPYQLKTLEENDPRSYAIQLKGAAAMRAYAEDRAAVRCVLKEALTRPITPRLDTFARNVLGEDYDAPKTIGTGVTCWLISLALNGDSEAVTMLKKALKSSTVKAFEDHDERGRELLDMVGVTVIK